jgi:exodeoxyribonuclease VII large subunit
MKNTLLQRRGRLDHLSGQIEALSPMAILERGYALVFDKSGKLVKDASQVKVGEEISARLAKGSVDSVVKKTRS